MEEGGKEESNRTQKEVRERERERDTSSGGRTEGRTGGREAREIKERRRNDERVRERGCVAV